ncbi:MAG: NUDIX domain-containing protein [Caldimonas sp.]
MKTTSHGLLLLSASAELLLCHATGRRYWDIPKGAAGEGEAGAAAALRETREECGLAIDPGALVELGRFAYLAQKDLALHAVLIERIDPRRCRCSSFFCDPRGRRLPEMDAFAWIPFADVPQRCAKGMTKVLTRDLSLAALLAGMARAGPPSVARFQDPTGSPGSGPAA